MIRSASEMACSASPARVNCGRRWDVRRLEFDPIPPSLQNIEANQIITIREDDGIISTRRFGQKVPATSPIHFGPVGG